jgi:putative transposase
MIALVEERQARVGIAPLCDALGLARATFYRRRGVPPPAPSVPRERRAPRQALTLTERAGVLAVLHEERFVDLPPAQVWALRLDAGHVPPCSIRTMYRGYVLLDIFSRYVVGWLLARQESAALAKVLIAESCERQHIGPVQLIIHADRGPSMTSQPVALLLATLGAVPSHSRPQVFDDDPSPRPSSRRSSTGQTCRLGSAPTRTPRRSAAGSSRGTTSSIVMARWA